MCVSRYCWLQEETPVPVTLVLTMLGLKTIRSDYNVTILLFTLLSVCLDDKLICVCAFMAPSNSTGKISVNEKEQSSVGYVYAMGAVQEGRPLTTALSVQAGRLLYGGHSTMVRRQGLGLRLGLHLD